MAIKRNLKMVKKEAKADDFSDWVGFSTTKRNNSVNGKFIFYGICDGPQKKSFIFKIRISGEIKKFLKAHVGDRYLVVHHKEDFKRILLVKSDNGYRLAGPSKNKEILWLNFRIKTKLYNITEGYISVVPIYRDDGNVEFLMQ